MNLYIKPYWREEKTKALIKNKLIRVKTKTYKLNIAK
jgi:hypothetical protein